MDEEQEGFIELDAIDRGSFHIGYVHGIMDCQLTTSYGEKAVDWTWNENDDLAPTLGSGWTDLRVDERHELIFFQCGGHSGFVAK